MKSLLKLLACNIAIFPFISNIISCNKSNVIDDTITSKTIINKLLTHNNFKLKLTDTNNTTINLLDENIQKEIFDNLDLNSEEQTYIDSINTYNNIFYINEYKTIIFNVKNDLNSTNTTPISISGEWTDNIENINNNTIVTSISNLIKSKDNIIINDNTISNDNDNTINLNNSYVKNSILTNIELENDWFSYILNISNQENNIIENGKSSLITFEISNLNNVTIFVSITITWNNSETNEGLLKKELENQINNQSIIELYGDNIQTNINDTNTKKIILNSIGISKIQQNYINLTSNESNLKLNNYILITYIININGINDSIDKDTILYNQNSIFNNTNVKNIIYDTNDDSYFTLIDNDVWIYNSITNDFIKLTKNDNFSNNTIESIFYANKNLYVDFKDLGIGILKNNEIIPTYYNAPKIITSYYYDDKNTNIYFGSYNQGLYYLTNYNEDEIQTYDNDKTPIILSIFKGFDNKIYSAIKYDNENKIGGIWSMQNKNISEMNESVDVLSDLSVNKVLNINDVLYAFTNEGIYSLKENDPKFTKINLNNIIDTSDIISQYYYDNILYIGTLKNGLWKINLSDNSSENISSKNITNTDTIGNICFFKKDVLIISKFYNDNEILGETYYNVV